MKIAVFSDTHGSAARMLRAVGELRPDAVVVLVHLVTMPVELNASRRALASMESLGLVSSDSEGIARKLLTAAALTYFVALASVLVQFLRLLSLSRRRN